MEHGPLMVVLVIVLIAGIVSELSKTTAARKMLRDRSGNRR